MDNNIKNAGHRHSSYFTVYQHVKERSTTYSLIAKTIKTIIDN